MIRKSFYLAFFLFISASVFFGQSDYEKTQNFKKQYSQIEDSIKSASSLTQLNNISMRIDQLKNDFVNDKELLDKSLYPETFSSSFDKIENALSLRRGDFTQISTLISKVDTLQSVVVQLNKQNDELVGKIKELNMQVEKDAATISSLQKLTEQLRANIQQRDQLVRDLVDSLLAEFIKTPTGLNETERKSLASKVDSRNLFYNIERTIADNIQFIKVTRMTPEDLADMKQQYRDFNKAWKQIGSKLGAVYLNKKEKISEISNIDSMFSQWNMKINNEMWGQVNQLFIDKNINLLPYNDADQFVNSVETFIGDEIKNYDVKSRDESKKIFYTFTDSVYFKSVEPKWIPILISNKMMTQANKDTIEVRITKWKAKVAPSTGTNWLYIGAVAVIIILLIVLISRSKRKSIPADEKSQE